MTEIERLQLFIHLSRTLHFARTAHECHISPSGLTRAIQGLERGLGTALFDRDARSVRLTPAGERLQARAAAVVHEWDALRREARESPRALAGALSVYCTVTAAQSVVPRVLSVFRTRHPQVRVDLETGYAVDALERVQDGRVDLSVAALPARPPAGVVALELATTPLVFVAPRAAGSVSEAVEGRAVDWSAVPLVLPAAGLARRYVDSWLRLRRLTPTVYAEPLGHEAVLSLVALGCGVGVVPALVVEKSALRADVRVLDVDPPLEPFRIGLCARRASLRDPLVAAVWEAARQLA